MPDLVASTVSNVGSGQGVFKQRTGMDSELRSITATSSKISLANNTNDIGIDVPDASTTVKGAVELATDGEVASSVAVQGNDWRLDPITSRQKRLTFTSHFWYASTDALSPWTTSVNGTGAAVAPALDAGTLGVWSFSTGTTTTGRAGLQLNNSNPKYISILVGTGTITVLVSCKVTIAATAAQDYVFRVGLLDSLTGAATDGVYFEYNRATSANWILRAVSNGTVTTTTSSTAVDPTYINTSVRFKIVINTTPDLATFYLNDTSIGTITSGFPSAAGRETSLGASIIKSAGTTARDFFIWNFMYDNILDNAI